MKKTRRRKRNVGSCKSEDARGRMEIEDKKREGRKRRNMLEEVKGGQQQGKMCWER